MLAAATRRVLACTRPRARRSACPTPRLTLTATLRGKDGSPHFTDGNSEAEKGEVTGPRSQHQCLGGQVERKAAIHTLLDKGTGRWCCQPRRALSPGAGLTPTSVLWQKPEPHTDLGQVPWGLQRRAN